MARKINRTTNATSGYQGGRQGLTDPATGKLSHGGKYRNRNQIYRDIRGGLGLSSG